MCKRIRGGFVVAVKEQQTGVEGVGESTAEDEVTGCRGCGGECEVMGADFSPAFDVLRVVVVAQQTVFAYVFTYSVTYSPFLLHFETYFIR